MTDAYAAGLIDGEGCIGLTHPGIKKHQKVFYYVRIDVGMAEKAVPVLYALMHRYGGRVRLFRKATKKWAAAYGWHLVGSAASRCLERISPYLSLKAEQARLCLTFQRMLDSLPATHGGHGGKERWTSEAREKAELLRGMIQELNRKGPNVVEPHWFARVVGDYLLTPQLDMFSDLGFTMYSGTLPDSGFFANGYLYAQPTSALRIFANAFLQSPHAKFWPTARSEDGESCGNHPGAVDSLTGAARMWATATAHDGRRPGSDATSTEGANLKRDAELWNTPHGMSNRDFRGKVGGCGGGQFALQANHWETPRASTGGLREYDGKRGVGVNTQASHWQTPASDSFRSRGGARKEEMGLDQEARAFASPPDPTTADGLTSCESGQTSRQPCPPTPTKRLNPRFVEFLMGLPIGWTEL